jgi:uncharacterized protein
LPKGTDMIQPKSTKIASAKSSKTNSPAQKSRRLQKKLYLGEFAVIGFEFSVSLANFDESQFETFFDGLIAFIESRDLEIGGGGSKDNFNGYIAPNARYGKTTDEDRKALEDFLKTQEGVSDIKIEPLSDAYYGQ